jgi:hypothetical protein
MEVDIHVVEKKYVDHVDHPDTGWTPAMEHYHSCSGYLHVFFQKNKYSLHSK